jgi:hypothetical protein
MYKGNFKFKNSNGSKIRYLRGDLVVDQGRVYSCLKTTTNSPIQDKKSWSPTGLVEPYYGSEPPVNPIQNQLWIDENGKSYTWFKDTNGFQWVSI